MAQFSEQRMQRTEARFRERSQPRRVQQEKLESLGKGSSWWEVEDPSRMVERLVQLRRRGDAGEALVEASRRPLDIQSPDLLERIIADNDLIPIRFLTRGAERSRAVGRVAIRSPAGILIGYGTGFMVSPRLLMTNQHVLTSASDAVASKIQFDFVETESGQILPLVEFALKPAEFFLNQKDLDFALVAVEARNLAGNLLSDRGIFRLIAESGKALIGERVNIIQHPAGEPLQVALRDNTIVDVFDDFLHYVSDTEQGSSGAPVSSDQWELAALHHSGVPKRNSAGKILLQNGQVWNGSDAGAGDIAWAANEGVRISSIVARIKALTAGLPSAQKSLVSEMLSLGSATPEAFVFSRDSVPAAVASTNPGPSVDEDGRVSWVVPVKISVSVGDIGMPFPIADSSKVPVAGDLAPITSVLSTDSSVLNSALKLLKEAETRPYYSPEEDAEAISTYYGGLQLDDPDGVDFFEILSDLLQSTHSRVLSYDAARHQYLYPWIDLREVAPPRLRSVYSDQELDPAEIIRQDIEIQARRDELIRERFSIEALSGENLESFLDDLESQMPFNCEHVVPQSWFNKKSPMRSDLHHLFSCEIACNSFRGNIPYFNFGPEAEAVLQHCGRHESLRFEPAAGKGAVARATLYFLLRYPGKIGDGPNEMPRDRVETLLLWHEAFAPDNWEKHRNAEIAKVQGNRNPLIDFPSLARRIHFERGFSG